MHHLSATGADGNHEGVDFSITRSMRGVGKLVKGGKTYIPPSVGTGEVFAAKRVEKPPTARRSLGRAAIYVVMVLENVGFDQDTIFLILNSLYRLVC
jgi:hypothetical protein